VRATLFVLAGLVFLFWIYGMSRPMAMRPRSLWTSTGQLVVLLIGIALLIVGFALK
jgi:hypothetical protein